MKIIYFILIAMFTSSFANAVDLDTKIAASFAAKYDICSKKIKNSGAGLGWKIKAGIAKEKADEINRERLLERGYIKSFEKEKKKIKRNWNVKRCKKFVNQHIGN
jgi:hypothetical protein